MVAIFLYSKNPPGLAATVYQSEASLSDGQHPVSLSENTSPQGLAILTLQVVFRILPGLVALLRLQHLWLLIAFLYSK